MATNTAVLQIEPGRPSGVALLDAVPPPNWQNERIFFKLCYKALEAASILAHFEMWPTRVSLVLHTSEEGSCSHRANDDVASTAEWTRAILKDSIRSKHALT